MKNFIALKQKNFKDETNNFFLPSFWCETGNYVKLVISLNEMEKMKFQSSRVRTLFWHLLVRYRNCNMKLLVWMIQKIYRMLNQSAVEIPALPVDQCPSHFIRYLKPETEIMKETPWSRIRWQQRGEEFLEIVGNGKPTGSVLEETIAVSATISITVEIWHSRIRLRILSCRRMREKHPKPEVPEERVPVVECLDGPARITSKDFAPILWKVAPSRMHVLQDQEWLQIWRKVLFCANKMMTKVQ